MRVSELFENAIILEKEGGWWDRHSVLPKSKYTKASAETKVIDRKKAENTALMYIKDTGNNGPFSMADIVNWLSSKKARVHGVVLEREFIKKFCKEAGINPKYVGSTKKATASPTQPAALSTPSPTATAKEWKNWASTLSTSDPTLYAQLKKVMRWKI